MPRRSAIVLIAVLGALFAPAGAQAATTLGLLPTAAGPPFIACAASPGLPPTIPPSPGLVVWQGTAGTASSVVPAGGGVVTDMRTAFAGAPGTPVEFVVVRPGSGTFTSVADVPAVIEADGSAEADTRIPVEPGDVLGIANGATGMVNCTWMSGVPGDGVALGMKPAGGLGVISPIPVPFPGTRANVAGTLEPDADDDGYGDDSQDGCGTDASTQGPCGTDASLTASAVEKQVTVGDLQVVTYKVSVASTFGTARGARLSVGLPSGLDVIASSSSAGSCSGGLTCDLGDLPAGSSAVVVAVLRATSAGAKTLSSSVSTSVTDLNAANNGANVAFDVVGPAAPVAPVVQAAAPSAAAPLRCRVVKLANLSQDAARKALVAGNCRLGKVSKPRKIRKGARLRVSRQSIPHGLEGPVGTKVDVTMKQVGGKKAAKKKRKR